MEYGKKEAFDTLGHLQEDYRGMEKACSELKAEIQENEECEIMLKTAKRGAKRFGIGLTCLFGIIGVGLAFASPVAAIVLASLAGVSLIGTGCLQAYYNFLIKINGDLMQTSQEYLDLAEGSKKVLIERIDAMQDVIYSNKPVDEFAKETIDEWKDTSGMQQIKKENKDHYDEMEY